MENYYLHWGFTDFRGKTILDLGADFGSTANFFLKLGARHVIAVESRKEWYEKLKLLENVTPINLHIKNPTEIEELLKYNPDLFNIVATHLYTNYVIH